VVTGVNRSQYQPLVRMISFWLSAVHTESQRIRQVWTAKPCQALTGPGSRSSTGEMHVGWELPFNADSLQALRHLPGSRMET
jgi:hypothetical protein